MKWYSYIGLTVICELLSILSIYRYSSNSANLLRIAYLEKTALQDFSFNPFPLFVTLCSLMNIILAIIFISSNIPKKEFIISRFNSRQQYFGHLIKKQAANILIASAATTIAPALFTALLCGYSDIAKLIALFFLRQFSRKQLQKPHRFPCKSCLSFLLLANVYRTKVYRMKAGYLRLLRLCLLIQSSLLHPC